MKKNVLYYLAAIMVFCCIASCEDEKDNHKEKWMITNIGELNTIKMNPEYKELHSPGNEGSIYYKVIKAGEGKDTIRYTNTISCYFKGWFIADYPEYSIKAGGLFDRQLFDDGPPVYYNVGASGLIRGWKTALQNMVVGDKWEIWVPYQLGYGRDDYKQSSSSFAIPGFSTLVFELEVLKILQ